MKPDPEAETPPKPDFMERLRSTYGELVLEQTATELIGEGRGDR
jgi:hypothetical protein